MEVVKGIIKEDNEREEIQEKVVLFLDGGKQLIFALLFFGFYLLLVSSNLLFNFFVLISRLNYSSRQEQLENKFRTALMTKRR